MTKFTKAQLKEIDILRGNLVADIFCLGREARAAEHPEVHRLLAYVHDKVSETFAALRGEKWPYPLPVRPVYDPIKGDK